MTEEAREPQTDQVRTVSVDPLRVLHHSSNISSDREKNLTSELAHALAAVDTLATENRGLTGKIEGLEQLVDDQGVEIMTLRERLGIPAPEDTEDHDNN